MVEEYRLARHNEEMKREESCMGYATETTNYPPLITFQEWLLGLRQEH